MPPPTTSAASPPTLLMPIWRWRAGDGRAADSQDSVVEPVCRSSRFSPGLSPPPCSGSSRGARDPASREVVACKVPPPRQLLPPHLPRCSRQSGVGTQVTDRLFRPCCPRTLTSSTVTPQHHSPAPGKLSFAGASRGSVWPVRCFLWVTGVCWGRWAGLQQGSSQPAGSNCAPQPPPPPTNQAR